MAKKKPTGDKVEPIIPKKRGRKPKGGKIITVTENVKSNEELVTNVIVHLKCKKSDICENDTITNPITSTISENITDDQVTSYSSYENYKNVENTVSVSQTIDKSINEKLKALQKIYIIILFVKQIPRAFGVLMTFLIYQLRFPNLKWQIPIMFTGVFVVQNVPLLIY